MLTGQAGVKYGLTVPKKNTQPIVKKSVLGFGDDDEPEDERSAISKQIKRQSQQKQANKKVAQMQADALAEDPSIFDYDAHYETAQQEKQRAQPTAAPERKSKYIQNLLDKAKERDREQDIVYNRRLVKEREVEDHLFGDKDRFVTAAYRKKLEEDKKWQEEEKLQEAVEAANDVRKQGMDGFYRNLLTKNVAMGAPARNSKANLPDPHSPEDRRSPQPSAKPALSEASGPAPPERTSNDESDWEKQRKAREAYEAAQALQTQDLPAQSGHKERGGSSIVTPPDDPGEPEEASAAKIRQKSKPDDEKEAVQPPMLSKEEKAAQARERFLARKRKLGN